MDRLSVDMVLGLLRMRDPAGVISIYAETTPDRQGHDRPQWAIAIRNGMRDLEERVHAEGPRERSAAVSKRLHELEPDVERFVDPALEGRGRALFAPVNSPDERTLFLQAPVPDLVVLRDRAHVRPLVSVLDEGRPAGVVFADRTGVRLWEVAFGQGAELEDFDFSEPGYSDRLKGPRASHPGMHQAPTQRDAIDERRDDHRVHFIGEVAPRVRAHMKARGWDRIVLAGDAKFTDPIVESFAGDGCEVLWTEHDFRRVSAPEVADVVAPILDAAQREWEVALVNQARDAAGAGGHGALGLTDVLGALHEGRVQHLLYDETCELRGYQTEEGWVAPYPASPGDRPEPDLVERMVERALDTGALVTPVSGSATPALAGHDGVAAILRW